MSSGASPSQRPRRFVRWAGRGMLLVAAVAASCSMPSCYSATEIQISIDTDVACSVVRARGVAVFVASSPDSLHAAAPVATANDCTEGPSGAHVGTLTFVPSGERDERVAIEVVVGVDRPTEECFPSTSGCIVARRAPRYIAHTSVRLPVRLSTRCKDARCAASETCNDDTGQCVPLEGCGAEGCVTPGDGGVDASADGPVADAACPPGFASCDGNPANGCETELAASNAHCGACGHACGDQVCTAGTCGAAVIMGTVAMPSAISVSGNDVFVTSEVGAPNGSLVTCKTTGCALPQVLVGAMTNPNAVAADPTHVYFSSSDKFLRRCERPACAAPIMFGNDSFSSLFLTATDVFAVSEYNAYSIRLTKADGGGTLLSTSNPLVMAVDPSGVFIVADTGPSYGLLRCPLTGCEPFGSPPQYKVEARDVRGIAVDAQFIYWTETDKGRVVKVPKDFLGPEVALTTTARRPVDVQVDNGFVYWTEEGTNDTDGTVNSDAAAGGSPLVLARDQQRPHRLTVSGGRVYWTNRVAAGSVLAVRAR